MHQLSVLNDKEFEELAKDLLELELGIKLQNFKRGRDKGIDLRYSTEVNNNNLIVQVKHYPKSKFSDLKRALLTDEKPKIEILKPDRYILFTSLPLNPGEADILFEGLSGYIRTTNDIYGEDRVLALLRNYPEIEQRFFKLWLSSTAVMKRVLHNAIEGRSLFFAEKIYKKVSLYVPTQNFGDALRILTNKKIVIITGQPGVGKTTISYLLICQLLSRDFKLILINDSIQEAESILSDDPEERQVIFFDDFLGSNINEVLHPRNTESTVVNFIERIQNSKNKYIIFTTRTTILNQVEFQYEKFRRVKKGQNLEFEVEMKEYTKYDRARILYNHIFHSELEEEQKESFLLGDAYMKVIEHRNYSPRLIEFITTKRFFTSKEISFKEHIFRNLDNPNELWQSAFDNQLTDYDRFLLWSVFSLGGSNVKEDKLEQVFERRLEYEIKTNGFSRANNAYIDSVKKLVDGFLTAYRSSDDVEFSYVNPSVGDFLIAYLRNRKQERKRIILSIRYFDQLIKFFDTKENKGKILLDDDELIDFYEYFRKECVNIEPLNEGHNKAVAVLDVYIRYLGRYVVEEDLIGWIERVTDENIAGGQFYSLVRILESLVSFNSCRTLVLRKFNKVAFSLFQNCDVAEEFEQVVRLFTLYNVSFQEFLKFENNLESISDLVSDALNREFRDNYTEFVDSGTIVGSVRNGSTSDAVDIVDNLFRDYTSEFIWSSKLTSIDDENLSESLDELITDYSYVDSEDIVNSVLENSDYSEEDDFYEDYYRYEGSRMKEFRENKNVLKGIDRIFKREPTEEDRIRDLFD